MHCLLLSLINFSAFSSGLFSDIIKMWVTYTVCNLMNLSIYMHLYINVYFCVSLHAVPLHKRYEAVGLKEQVSAYIEESPSRQLARLRWSSLCPKTASARQLGLPHTRTPTNVLNFPTGKKRQKFSFLK